MIHKKICFLGRAIAVLLLGLTAALSVQANPISKRVAKSIAARHFAGLHASEAMGAEAMEMGSEDAVELVYSLGAGTTAASGALEAYSEESQMDLYVFSPAGQSGFVVVSGDDALPEVLGYSDEARFRDDSVSNPGLHALLQYYAQAVRRVRTRGGRQELFSEQWDPIEPLLKNKQGQTIQWDQTQPYNAECPEYSYGMRSATGCVATAIAQIMYYHEWPRQAVGVGEYYVANKTGVFTRILGAKPFDWAAMQPRYDRYSTNGEAVANLMAEVGAAVGMHYGRSSGTTNPSAARGLMMHLGYSRQVSVENRRSYTTAGWREMLRKELAAGRPMLVTGVSAGGGHAFVCDATDAQQRFHINWGWSGWGDGYFFMDDMEPEASGTGAGSDGGYVLRLAAFKNLSPDRSGTPPPTVLENEYEYTALNIKTGKYKRNETVGANFANVALSNHVPDHDAALYVALVKDGRAYNVDAKTGVRAEFRAGAYYPKVDRRLRVPRNVPEGTYDIGLVVEVGSKNYLAKCISLRDHYEAVVTHSHVEIRYKGNASAANLSARMLAPSEIIPGRENVLTFEVTNSGDEVYSSYLALELKSTDHPTQKVTRGIRSFAVAGGRTKTISIKVAAPWYNQYYAILYYDKSNGADLKRNSSNDLYISDVLCKSGDLSKDDEKYIGDVQSANVVSKDTEVIAGERFGVTARLQAGPKYGTKGVLIVKIGDKDKHLLFSFPEKAYRIKAGQSLDVTSREICTLTPGTYFAQVEYKTGSQKERMIDFYQFTVKKVVVKSRLSLPRVQNGVVTVERKKGEFLRDGAPLFVGDRLTIAVVASPGYEYVEGSLTVKGRALQPGQVYTVKDSEGTIVVTARFAKKGNGGEPGPNAVEASEGGYLLSPNPASDFVRIDGLSGRAHVLLFSANGHLVRRAVVEQDGTLDVRGLASGFYILRVDGKVTLRMQKL